MSRKEEYCEELFRVLREESNEVKKLVNECNTQSLDAIHTFDIDIERNKNKCPLRQLDMFDQESFQHRQDFKNNCICTKQDILKYIK